MIFEVSKSQPIQVTCTSFSTGNCLKHLSRLSAGFFGHPVRSATASACLAGSGLTAPGDNGAPDRAATPVALRPSGDIAMREAALPPEPWPITTTRFGSPPKN